MIAYFYEAFGHICLVHPFHSSPTHCRFWPSSPPGLHEPCRISSFERENKKQSKKKKKGLARPNPSWLYRFFLLPSYPALYLYEINAQKVDRSLHTDK